MTLFHRFRIKHQRTMAFAQWAAETIVYNRRTYQLPVLEAIAAGDEAEKRLASCGCSPFLWPGNVQAEFNPDGVPSSGELGN